MSIVRRFGAFGILLAAAGGPAAHAEEEPPVQAVAIGDFDADGIPDVAVGLPALRVGKVKEAGEVRAYSGKSGAFLWSYAGKEEEAGCGESLAAVGDMDGDGASDLAVGVPWGDSGAKVDFVSGKSGRLIRSMTGGSLIGFGEELCAVGDGSGKARVDVIARTGSADLRTYVYTEKEAVGAGIKDPSGMSGTTFCAGDVDGDGTADIGIGAFSEDAPGKKSAGRIRVLSGARMRGGSGKLDLLVLQGERANEGLGLAAGSAGDFNGDKAGDLLVGLPGPDRKKDPWTVRVLSGKDGAELWKATGEAGDFTMGGVVLLGDVDADGSTDVAVSRPGRNRKAGAVSAVSGKDGAVLWTLEGVPGEMLGDQLLPAADADADGVRDLVVVAPGSAVKGKKGNGYLRLVSGKTGKVVTLFHPLVTK